MNKKLLSISKLRELLAKLLCLLMIFCVACSEDPNVVVEGDGVYEEETEDEDEKEEEKEEEEPEDDSSAFDEYVEGENDLILYNTSDYAVGASYSRTFYVDCENGDDTSMVMTENTPLKTLDVFKTTHTLQSGDRVLLKGSTTSEYKGSIIINGLDNVHIGSYGDCKARINAQGEFAGVYIHNSSNVTISDIKISADGYPTGVYNDGEGESNSDAYKFPAEDYPSDASRVITGRYGVLIHAGAALTIENINVYNVDIRDIYYFNSEDTYSAMSNRPCREWSTSYETEYGYGIRIYASSNAVVDSCKIDNCNINDVSHTGIKSNNNGKITNLHITKTNIYDAGGPGAQFNNVDGAVMDYCNTYRPGSSTEDGVLSTRKWGRGSGMWLHTCDGFLFDHNYYYRSEGVADCCGAHIDIGNTNVVIQYCLSVNNCGGFVEVLGNNYNCCYRYNISIDDGWRDISDTAQYSFWYGPTGTTVGTDGCLLTINGHTTGDYEGPYNTYIYNNTVISSSSRFDGYTNPFTFEVSTSSEGVLIANNIFYTPLSSGDRYSVSWSEHTYDTADDGGVTYVDNAYDYKKGISTNGWGSNYSETAYMTNDEVYALNHEIRNNLYQAYDETAYKTLYPYAENIFYDNGNVNGTESGSEDARYRDFNPLSGDPGFSFVGGQNPENYTAEHAIPTNSTVINRGIEISSNTLRLDGTVYKISYKPSSESIYESLDLGVDYFGRTITTPILGACVVQ